MVNSVPTLANNLEFVIQLVCQTQLIWHLNSKDKATPASVP